jgi:hypothetical protein
MKTMIIVAVAAMGLASGVAYAVEGGPEAESPGVVTQAPAQNVPAATAQREQTTSHSPWLFPPIGKYLDQHAG